MLVVDVVVVVGNVVVGKLVVVVVVDMHIVGFGHMVFVVEIG